MMTVMLMLVVTPTMMTMLLRKMKMNEEGKDSDIETTSPQTINQGD